jgi:hypothetical protein
MNIFSKILKYINNYKFYFIFISLSFLTYIVGFFLRENSAGGGKIDLVYEWNNHLLLRDNLLNFIYYPLIYDGARIPLYQILSILINPFTDNILSYVNYFFLYSFLIPLLFFLCIKKKYKDFSLHQLLLLTSVIFFSPYFRTSSYWGLQENLAYVFLLSSYLIYKENLFFKENKIRIFFLALTSCLAFYSDQKFIFLSFYYFFDLIKIYEIKKWKLELDYFYIFIIFFILAIPALYIFYKWEGIVPPELHKRLKTFNYFSFINFFQVFSFYIAPFLLLQKNFFRKFLQFVIKKKFAIFLYFYFFSLFFIFFDSNFLAGGGWLHKLYIIFSYNKLSIIAYHLLSFLLFLLSYYFLNLIKNDKKNYIIIFILLLIALFSNPFFQEYFDPLIFILIILFFNKKNFLKVRSFNIFILYLFYSFLLLFSVIYYYFKDIV